MKKHILYTLLLLVLIAGCKKYEDGPWLSLKTKEARATGKWQFEYLEMNGIDSTSAFLNAYSETPYFALLPKDKNGDNVIKTVLGYGKWGFYDHHDYIFIRDTWIVSGSPVTVAYNSNSVDWEILRLTNKELWLKD